MRKYGRKGEGELRAEREETVTGSSVILKRRKGDKK